MVERYVGDCGQHGCNDICGIQSAAHAYLDDSYIHILGCEPVESHHHGKFEERWIYLFVRFPPASGKVYYLFLSESFRR